MKWLAKLKGMWDYERKRLLVIGLSVSILALGGIVWLFTGSSENQKGIAEHTEFILEEDQSISKVVYSERTEETWLIVDKKKVKKLSTFKHHPSPLFTLPVSDKQVNLTFNKPSSELTWDSTPEQSQAFINYLLSENYTVLRKAVTSDYIELFLTKEGSAKRLIVFHNSFMYGDLEDDFKLPAIETYISKYTY